MLKSIYDNHHNNRNNKVAQLIDSFGQCIIVDLHSYPKEKLQYEISDGNRPELCIGTDSYHTDSQLVDVLTKTAEKFGYEYELNTPFSGALVPMRYYEQDKRVRSVMLEWRRDIYLDGLGQNSPKIIAINSFLTEFINSI